MQTNKKRAKNTIPRLLLYVIVQMRVRDGPSLTCGQWEQQPLFQDPH